MGTTCTRRSSLSLLILATIIALVGGLTLDVADAKGRTKVKTSLTIRERVDIQTDNCEIAGGEISVSYAYETDGSESATTSCSGGLLDGNVCINEATTMECYQAGRVAPPLRGLDGTRPNVTITEVQVEQPTPEVMVPAGIDEKSAPTGVNGDEGTVTQPGDGSVVPNPVEVTDTTQSTAVGDSSTPVLVPLD